MKCITVAELSLLSMVFGWCLFVCILMSVTSLFGQMAHVEDGKSRNAFAIFCGGMSTVMYLILAVVFGILLSWC